MKDALADKNENTGIVGALVTGIKSDAGITYENQESDSEGMVKLGPFAPRDVVNIIVKKEGYDQLTNFRIPVPISDGTEDSPKTVKTQQVTLNPNVSNPSFYFISNISQNS